VYIRHVLFLLHYLLYILVLYNLPIPLKPCFCMVVSGSWNPVELLNTEIRTMYTILNLLFVCTTFSSVQLSCHLLHPISYNNAKMFWILIQSKKSEIFYFEFWSLHANSTIFLDKKSLDFLPFLFWSLLFANSLIQSKKLSQFQNASHF
jgi:hypothetical protein